ncbi:hypothetical protein FRX31_005537 [Thalictrum thalictroides]|uniref:Zinc knuckle (CCHC-type) family protein n=1 Tax=Thalictrum thalictroides TaxID=46969 RepID=A0A7J6X4Z8_THATH|nr:hypothetical protein FRX31_005537 [Thalictrum thalictroides]
MGADDVRELTVDFPWKPSICSKCNTFGHSLAQCEKKSSNVWVPNRKFRRMEKGQPSNDHTQKANGKAPMRGPNAVDVTAQGKTNWVRKDKGIAAPSSVLSNRFQRLEVNDDEEIIEEGELTIVEPIELVNNEKNLSMVPLDKANKGKELNVEAQLVATLVNIAEAVTNEVEENVEEVPNSTDMVQETPMHTKQMEAINNHQDIIASVEEVPIYCGRKKTWHRI